MTFQEDVLELHKQNTNPKGGSIDFPECRGMTFREFWDWLPDKLEFYDYWEEMYQTLEEKKHLWVKKCAGIGMTEFMLRWLAWNCLKDDEWRNTQKDVNIILIVGPRLDLAITIIQRMKDMFPEGTLPKTAEDMIKINGNKIKAYPSHHVASAHGLNPKVVWNDEGDFFPVGQQDKVREVNERYIAKTNPYLIWTSTPYLPGGLYEQIEDEPEDECIYTRKLLLLDRALASGHYTEDSIKEWKKSPSFMREAYGEYGYGTGDIFSNMVDDIIEEYDINYQGGQSGTYADPAFGSSLFGIISAEKRSDGLIYITEAHEHERALPSSMIEVMKESWGRHKQACKIDAANSGFIRELKAEGIPAVPVAFGQSVPITETGKMSIPKSSKNHTVGAKTPQTDTTTTLKKKLPINASSMVKDKKIRIHPVFKKLISQMRAVRFDKMGGIDKSEVPFDLVDAFDMMAWDLKENDYSSIGIRQNGTLYKDPKPKSKSVRVNIESY